MRSFDRVRPFFYEHRWRIAIGVLCLITVDMLQLTIPRVVKWAVDDLTLPGGDTGALAAHGRAIVGIAIGIGIFRYVWRRCLIGTSRYIEEGLRNRLFEHIQTLSAPFFDQSKTGDLMAHATNDLNHIRMATGMGMVALTDALVLGISAIGFMFYISIPLTLLVLIPMPLIIFGTRFFGTRMHRRYQQVQGAFSDLTETVREHVAGIRTVRAFASADLAQDRVARASNRYVTENVRLVRITGAFFPLMIFLSNLSMVIVIYLGGRLTLTAHITPGDFVAFISYLGLLTWPMMASGWVINLIQRGRASLDRIDAILSRQPDISNPKHPKPLPPDWDAIGVSGITFAYPEGGTGTALSNIELVLPRGSVTGVVGPPGCGKTTLAALLTRQYDPDTGTIRFGDIPMTDLPLETVHSQISLMPQEPFLFSGTISENITFDAETADTIDSDRLDQAASDAALRDTIRDFPEGYRTVVGERGITLSGGQRQRVALARALYWKRPVLILDDPISQVDTRTGRQIAETLRTVDGDRTVVIISHRLSAVVFADQIIVMADGRIIDRGTHDELMARGGYYADTYRFQELEAGNDARGFRPL